MNPSSTSQPITPELVEKTTLLKFFATHTPLGLLATL